MSDADRIIVGNTRPQGDGFIGGNWTLLRMIPQTGGAEAIPASGDAGIKGGRAADLVWAAVVMDGNDEEAERGATPRTFSFTFGRFVAGSGKPKIPADFEIPLDEDVVTTSSARPDLVYLQPTFGDTLYARLSDVGDLDAAEFVWLFYKFTNRQS